MGDNLSLFFPPKLTLNDSSFPDLKDKVYIVTGASAGIGKELTRLLYSRNATVYLAARSAEKTNAAISWIQEQHPGSTGKLKYLHLQLSDLEGIKASAESFLAQETRLDVLFNNAAFLAPSGESHTKQGFEEHLGVNCIAPFLFTKLLTPVLLATAKKEEGAAKGSVRVVWVSSVAAGMRTPKGGLDLQDLDYKKKDPQGFRYAISKAGNLLHALEYRRRYGGEGVVGVVCISLSLSFFSTCFLPPRLLFLFLSSYDFSPVVVTNILRSRRFILASSSRISSRSFLRGNSS